MVFKSVNYGSWWGYELEVLRFAWVLEEGKSSRGSLTGMCSGGQGNSYRRKDVNLGI